MAVPGVQALWPDTLAKFWGLHAVAWSASGVSLAVRGLRGTAPAAGGAGALLCAGAATLAGANLAVSVLLYRTDEEAGAALAAAAALWFASATALLQAATKLGLGGGAVRTLRSLRLWHVAMALGSCVFVAKALSKDRLFAQARATALPYTACAHTACAHGMCTACALCIADTSHTHARTHTHTHTHCTTSHAVRYQSEELLRRGSARGAALPLLVVVNQGAGAKLGAVVAEALSQRSADVAAAGGTMRVVDVADTAPREALRAFASEHAAYRVLVCGGDGTVTWVLAAIEELLAEAGGEAAGSEAADAAVAGGWAEAPYRPAVGILPLGTGNDLARVLGWGKSFRRERMLSQLAKLDRSRIAALDRWQMRGSLPEGRAETRLCNYCSIGVDAKAALLWARLSEARPELFKLRLLNKLWYIICGTPEFALHSFSDLHARWFETAPACPRGAA